MRVTSTTLSEVDSVVDLVNQAYRGVTSGGWTTEAGLIEGSRVDRTALSQMMQDGRTTILIAKDQASQAIQGCVAVRPMENGEWYLSMLAVNPACQANGIGKSIMAAAEAFVGERGGRSVKISVINVRDSLIAWYERRGYVRTGDIEPFPYDDPSVGVPLRNDLTLITLRKPLQQAHINGDIAGNMNPGSAANNRVVNEPSGSA
jgi:ribosomal protein S18 acetylase RimI-like enzyme